MSRTARPQVKASGNGAEDRPLHLGPLVDHLRIGETQNRETTQGKFGVVSGVAPSV